MCPMFLCAALIRVSVLLTCVAASAAVLISSVAPTERLAPPSERSWLAIVSESAAHGLAPAADCVDISACTVEPEGSSRLVPLKDADETTVEIGRAHV